MPLGPPLSHQVAEVGFSAVGQIMGTGGVCPLDPFAPSTDLFGQFQQALAEVLRFLIDVEQTLVFAPLLLVPMLLIQQLFLIGVVA